MSIRKAKKFSLFIVFLIAIVPATTMANIFSIDPEESFVFYAPWYYDDNPIYAFDPPVRYSLSGTFNFDRLDGYSGIPEWSQVHFEARNSF